MPTLRSIRLLSLTCKLLLNFSLCSDFPDSIRPRVDDHASYLLSRISSLEETFVQREERLRVVRAEKLAKWNNMRGKCLLRFILLRNKSTALNNRRCAGLRRSRGTNF